MDHNRFRPGPPGDGFGGYAPAMRTPPPRYSYQSPCFLRPPVPSPSPSPSRSVIPQHLQQQQQQQQQLIAKQRELVKRVEAAIVKARCDLLGDGESVSAWKVSQAALLTLKAESWNSLGFREMQQVPSLKPLLIIEAKINAFIQCFVSSRGVTSIHDLEKAICQSEGIENFEELDLGPFLRHPLVKQCFALTTDVTEVIKITSEEIITYLGTYLYRIKGGKRVNVDEFLDFIAKRKSVEGKEKLGVRIHSLGLHISIIREARKSEQASARNGRVEELLDEDDISEDEDGNVFLNEAINPINEAVDLGEKSIEHKENLSCTDWLKKDMEERHAILTNESNYTNKGKRKKAAKVVMETSLLRIFIKTWEEPCRKKTVHEVLSMMFDKAGLSTDTRSRKKLFKACTTQPGIGLVNVAIASIRCGILDDLYDAIGKENLRKITLPLEDIETRSVDSSKVRISIAPKKSMGKFTQSATAEDILEKVSSYVAPDNEIISDDSVSLQKRLTLLKKVCTCDSWLAEQFGVEEFKALGCGDFFNFMEDHLSLLPKELQNFLIGGICKKSNSEVSLSQNQLAVMVSQALSSLWDGKEVTKKMISTLLVNQFPHLIFEVGDGSLQNLLNIVDENKSSGISKGVLFSQTLVETRSGESMDLDGEILEAAPTGVNTKENLRVPPPSSSRDVLEVLLRAPMLSDLSSWSHWDLVFAPSFGPLVGWLLNEVNSNDLLCLVTKDGRVIRIDHSASLDLFLPSVVQGSPFQMAVLLLSLFSIHGGVNHAPVSLLKSLVCHAFDVILKSHLENVVTADSETLSFHGGTSFSSKIRFDEAAIGHSNKNSKGMNDVAASTTSRYFLDCLGYLPLEFRAFAADVLLSGLRSVLKDAHSVLLKECRNIHDRTMLHNIGLSLGIVEWINDYNVFLCTTSTYLLESRESSESIPSHTTFVHEEIEPSSPAVEDENVSVYGKLPNTKWVAIGQTQSKEESSTGKTMTESEEDRYKEACSVIRSIRQEEFGLDSSLSNSETRLLKRQHARLGRALHCLSEELYSQDSHFLLELVQNADDNSYPENVVPTLTFILQDSGITVLNNEKGFSAQNIRALCDVGNSTKKGTNAGYIGKKGIGFKSVFRVTDAPEIHSNGFHLKFDRTEGEIGFVLPNLVQPCNVDALSQLVYMDSENSNSDCWNTCIVLPFKSRLLEGAAEESVTSMFADLHPSLLLFLHHLKCIRFRNMINNSLTVMKKEILGNGIVKVSQGEEVMNWFLVSQKLQANFTRRNVQITEIALGFTLQEIEEGKYVPCLDMQPVFAFLPLRTYGLKFILQGDFVLPSSREDVDGNDAWNQWLLSEFPSLFVNAQRSFCSLPCFEGNLGKAVTAYMSYVPLRGEVHGFFSSLPRMIINKLRQSNCLLLEGDNTAWAPPCKVLRGWNEQARLLLPDSLLREHLGLGFLDKDIILTDTLAKSLGIEEYGLKILIQVLTVLCRKKGGLQSMGFPWLSAWLNAVHTISLQSSSWFSQHSKLDADLLEPLRRLPFIPLSDGTFGSVDQGTIWLQHDVSEVRVDHEIDLDAFPNLYAKLRMVNHDFLRSLDVDVNSVNVATRDNIIRMLLRVGVQRLSAHEIVKVHVLPAVSDDTTTAERDGLVVAEFLCFVAVHLQSPCRCCRDEREREQLISGLKNGAFLLTSHGCKRPAEVPIHFGKAFGCPFDLRKLFDQLDMEWYEVDPIYLKHLIPKSMSVRRTLWRTFFSSLGITEFVQVVQVEKGVSDIPDLVYRKLAVETSLISGSVAKDWESTELQKLLLSLSKSRNRSASTFVLEVLDKLWDKCFSDKTLCSVDAKASGDFPPINSSFMRSICDVKWVASSMDEELHYPKDLFYDTDAVNSLLGSLAPYAVPKVKSGNLLQNIGFKSKVTFEDAVEILKASARSKAPFKSSIAQMARLYRFVWKEMDNSKKIMDGLFSEAFIFLPHVYGSGDKDVVAGSFFSVKDVCWNDSTGSMSQMKEINTCDIKGVNGGLLSKTLCEVYPNLRDFFVNQCGVNEVPTFRDYFQILLHMSAASNNIVFSIFMKLSDAVKSGEVSDDNILSVKEDLMKLEFRVLHTIHDKWVSLHPSYGLVCWLDDENLAKEFKLLDKVQLLSFGADLTEDEKDSLHVKLPFLMRTLGVPAFSEVLTRDAIYYGVVNSSCQTYLVEWVLPYAQRYVYHSCPEVYRQLKVSGFSAIRRLEVVVVETLFYRNIVKNVGLLSEKRHQISALLQGYKLYVTRECDKHTLFTELSRIFYGGVSDIVLANFLLMMTTMAESGSTESQLDFFIVNSQKMAKLPQDESLWSLAISDEGEAFRKTFRMPSSSMIKKKSPVQSGCSSNWPPTAAAAAAAAGWNSPTAISSSIQNHPSPPYPQPSSVSQTVNKVDEPEVSARSPSIEETVLAYNCPKEKMTTGRIDQVRAAEVGRLGERIAYEHFLKKFSNSASSVKWVNEDSETGLPYDILICDGKGRKLYMEVKATQSVEKDWFGISTREWQFAVDKGQCFSIVWVELAGANITVFRDPVELCRLGKLQLAVLMPPKQEVEEQQFVV